MNISVIIPIYKEIDNSLILLFESLRNLIKDDVEIIMIISKDSIVNNISENFNLKIIKVDISNTSYSINQGISQAKGDYIVICGARSFINQSYIDQCVSILEKDKTIGCVGGTISHAGKLTKGKAIARAMGAPLGMGLMSFRSKKSSGFVDSVSVPVFRKSIFDRIGYFDESLIRNQDDDMSYRIHQLGLSIWMDQSISSTYYVREKFTQLCAQFFQYGFWKNYVNRKHQTLTTLRQLAPPLFILLILVFSTIDCIYQLPFLPLLLLGYLVVLGSYSFIINTFKPIASFYSLVAFICMHLSYGCGYLLGFIYAFLLQKKAPNFVQFITR